MDIEALISSVFVRPAIWDKREKNHSNRNIVDTCWKEIAKELGVDEMSLRKKWKYLRDQFVVEFAKIHPSRSGDAGDSSYEPKWPYFKSMAFLKDVVKPRATSSNLSTATVEESAPPKEDSLTPPKRTSKSPCKKMEKESLPLCSPLASPRARKRHSGSDRYNEAILDIERKKLKYLQSKAEKQQNDDEDLLFFKSLLPHGKAIEPAKKLLFRSRIQEIVSQFAYPTSSPFPYSSHSSFPLVSPNTNSPRSCSSNTTQSPQISSPRPSPPPSNYPYHFPSTSPEVCKLSQPTLSPDSNPGVLQSSFPNPHI